MIVYIRTEYAYDTMDRVTNISWRTSGGASLGGFAYTYDAAGNRTTIDNLLAVKIGGATYYPLTDIQGTVWGYIDSQNNIVARWQYDAWGNVVEEEISSTATALVSLRYRFQGREWSVAAHGTDVNSSGVTVRRALPLDGNTGGLIKVLVPNPGSQIFPITSTPINSPF